MRQRGICMFPRTEERCDRDSDVYRLEQTGADECKNSGSTLKRMDWNCYNRSFSRSTGYGIAVVKAYQDERMAEEGHRRTKTRSYSPDYVHVTLTS